jgi:hypothetical protein
MIFGLLAYGLLGLAAALVVVTYRAERIDLAINGLVDELATDLDDRVRITRRLQIIHLFFIVLMWPVGLFGLGLDLFASKEE